MNKTASFDIAARFLELSELEAFAAERDPYKTWIHFILTDDKPNKNNQRIPRSEFDNLVATAKYMPIKKLVGGTGDQHEGAVPMGSIADAKISESDHVSRIEGIAALWNKEYPDDITHLRHSFDDGSPINFSWEIGYKEASDDKAYPGVETLLGCTLKAATIVGMPAYAGRTRALAMASNESFEDRIEKVHTALVGIDAEKYNLERTFSDAAIVKNNEDGKYYQVAYTLSDEGELLFDFDTSKEIEVEASVNAEEEAEKQKLIISRARITRHVLRRAVKDATSAQEKSGGLNMDIKVVKDLFKGLEPAEQAEAALDSLSDLFEEFESLKTERDDLTKEKEVREEEDRRAQVLRSRLAALKEAGIEYSDDDLEAKAKSLIDMSDDSFELFVKELAALAVREDDDTPDSDKETGASLKIPKITGKTSTKTSLEIIKETLTGDNKEEDK